MSFYLQVNIMEIEPYSPQQCLFEIAIRNWDVQEGYGQFAYYDNVWYLDDVFEEGVASRWTIGKWIGVVEGQGSPVVTYCILSHCNTLIMRSSVEPVLQVEMEDLDTQAMIAELDAIIEQQSEEVVFLDDMFF